LLRPFALHFACWVPRCWLRPGTTGLRLRLTAPPCHPGLLFNAFILPLVALSCAPLRTAVLLPAQGFFQAFSLFCRAQNDCRHDTRFFYCLKRSAQPAGPLPRTTSAHPWRSSAATTSFNDCKTVPLYRAAFVIRLHDIAVTILYTFLPSLYSPTPYRQPCAATTSTRLTFWFLYRLCCVLHPLGLHSFRNVPPPLPPPPPPTAGVRMVCFRRVAACGCSWVRTFYGQIS